MLVLATFVRCGAPLQIHTASLVHDDVIDEATTRRGMAAVNVRFSEKECVLAGDFILARATKLLAGLGNVRVIEIFAQVIEDLVRGTVANSCC